MKRYNEAVVINQGLGALKSCMAGMAGTKGAVANKNSAMLTKILGDLLSSNTKGMMRVLCTINPIVGIGGAIASLSRSTLDYAKEIKAIKIEKGAEKDLIALAKALEKGGAREAPAKKEKMSKMKTKGMTAEQQLSCSILTENASAKGAEFNFKVAMTFGDVSPEIADARAVSETEMKKPRETRDKHKYDNGAVYSGEWRGNIRDGKGVMTWPDKSKYEGQWHADHAHGTGKFVYSNGDIYDGQWKNDMTHGKGVYKHSDGTIFTGGFDSDLKHGKGEETWPDGAKYTGQFLLGKKQGKGVFDWNNGQKYEGQFFMNDIQGQGQYTWSDGRVYKGEWNDNKMHGKGKLIWKSGMYYEGQYVQDKRHGFGVLMSDDGRKYTGTWNKGKQHGKGVMEEDGKKTPGIWTDGKQTK